MHTTRNRERGEEDRQASSWYTSCLYERTEKYSVLYAYCLRRRDRALSCCCTYALQYSSLRNKMKRVHSLSGCSWHSDRQKHTHMGPRYLLQVEGSIKPANVDRAKGELGCI